MDTAITICDTPTDAIRDAILGPLADFNAQNGYPADPQPIAITLTDDNGEVVGGLWGKTVYDWLFVDYLVVPASMRGRDLGAKLMASAEQLAIKRGCVGSWLTTFTFQAQGFYERLGYEVFGSLDKSPRDNVRIFLRKSLRG
jgi:GNAT superfamily N-acetyltransferase